MDKAQSVVRGRVGRLPVIIMAVMLLVAPLTADANFSPVKPTPSGGGLVPPTATPDIRIERERLSFDWGTDPAMATVRASYDLASSAKNDLTLPLVFIAPESTGLSVTMNGAPLAARPTSNVQLPEAWLDVATGVDPRDGEEYALYEFGRDPTRNLAWSFELPMPAGGRGTLVAEYSTHLAPDLFRAERIVRHLAYVLGPARNWAGFGTLEVSATLPADYTLTARPTLPKLGQSEGIARYGATFDGIPAEILRISTVSTPGATAGWAVPVRTALPLVAAVVAGVLVGAVFSRTRRRFWAGAGAVLVGGTLATSAGMILPELVTPWLDPTFSERVSARGYMGSDVLWYLFLGLVVSPLLAAIIGAIWAVRGSATPEQQAGGPCGAVSPR